MPGKLGASATPRQAKAQGGLSPPRFEDERRKASAAFSRRPFVIFSHVMHLPILVLTVLSVGIPFMDARPARNPSYEPLAAPTAAGAANVFLNASVTASGHWDDRVPALAVNGDKNPADHWACENLPVWHQINLPQPAEIAAIRVWTYWGDGRVYQYKVEGSVDGKAWKMLADMTANSITSSAEGSFFQFDPFTVRHVRTTFLSNSRGAETGGHLVEIEGYARVPVAELGGGFGSTDHRYPPNGPVEGLKPAAGGIRLHGWRGERVSGQIVIQAETPHQALHFDPLVLTSGAASIPASTRFVRYTLADGKPRGDILDDAIQLDLAAGANRPAWIEINVPAKTPAGTYRGTLTARSNSSRLDFPIELEVLAATLPPPERWSIHLDLWQHPDAVARWHDVPLWSDAHFALLKPAMRRLAEAGQKTITTTLIHEAWGGQTYDRFPSMIQWRRKADGSWSYDYDIFDRWVAFMSDECGLGHARIHGYSMIPWSLLFRYYDESSNAFVDAKLEPGTAEYDAFWGAFLRDFTRHLRAKGWLERMRIAVDERPDALMRGALATLGKHAPEILVASAINHPSELTRTVDDISPIIGHTGGFPRALLDERRAAGRKTTFYVCTAPAVPNTFTFSPPAEAEWLPLFAVANGFDGFLRWAYHSWVENPLVSTDFVTWPSGDCFLVYPGDRSSIRFERLRDGIENFEKIHLLRQSAAANPSPEKTAALRAIDAVLADFTWERGRDPGPHTDDVRRANTAILEASRVIAD